MTLDDALQLINNAEIPEHRRFLAPQHSLTVFNREAEVLSVVKFKSRPTEREQIENLRMWPGCVQIFTRPGRFASVTELTRFIADSMWLFNHLAEEKGEGQ